MYQLTETQRTTLVNALYSAARLYEDIAADPMREQFERQARDARTLAEAIEDADAITLS